MKKTMSRILTLVLVLAMLVSVVPMALADEAAGTVTISGQPSGDVQEIYLTKSEVEQMRKTGQYIFKSYAAALSRAQD